MLSSHRPNPQKWLRRLHAWIGLALSALVLLFAVTGFLLNHRAIMKIPALTRQEVRQVVPVDAPPATPEALLATLLPDLDRSAGNLRTSIDKEKEVTWNGEKIRQPARWKISHDTPSRSIQVEYWVGSRQAEIQRVTPDFGLYLARLHMGIGAGPAWVLLADLLALSLAVLALSGFWMWGRLHGSRLRLGLIALSGLSLTATLAFLAG